MALLGITSGKHVGEFAERTVVEGSTGASGRSQTDSLADKIATVAAQAKPADLEEIATNRPARSTFDLVAAYTELGVTTLTKQQRLQAAQLLIGTVSWSDDDDDPERARIRTEGRASTLESLDVLDSIEVAKILAPTSEPTRSVAQKRRKAGELIGLPTGTRPNYRYPAFQLDRDRHRIHPLVQHANQRLDVENDPYGAASWWLTPTDILDGRSPLQDLEAHDLTEFAIDNIFDAAHRGM